MNYSLVAGIASEQPNCVLRTGATSHTIFMALVTYPFHIVLMFRASIHAKWTVFDVLASGAVSRSYSVASLVTLHMAMLT